MKELQAILKQSKKANQFTIINANDISVLLFEGRTVMACCQSDFHSGHEEAYFNKTLIKKNWSNPEHLQLLCEKMMPKSAKPETESHEIEDDIFEHMDKLNIYVTDGSFYPNV